MSVANDIMRGLKEANIFELFKDTPIERIKQIAEAESEGRIVVLERHRIANGSNAYAIWYGSNDKVVKGKVTHALKPYRMFFYSEEMAFPFNNGSIGEEVFFTESDALAKLEKYQRSNR